ncbi:hypothetical protein PQR62_18310 [Herbaspirillum lusitanum]|uniref:Uncharacterized protein n=2 Tax=Herbaspirillum lusitanum TaxID=213312 RepID=A0ABW9AFP1_9BURK
MPLIFTKLRSVHVIPLQALMLVFCAVLLSWSPLARAETSAGAAQNPDGPAGLSQQYETLKDQLLHNQYGKPLYLNSAESSDSVKGDIYAILDAPFSQVHAALGSSANWCDILILHLNTKYCRITNDQNKPMLRVHIGKKLEQDLDDTYRVDFNYRTLASNDTYFSTAMQADKGPLDTSNYRIRIEAIPLPDGRSFLHLMYSYSYGMASKIALRAYLATIGRDKVGFTVTGKRANGEPEYVRGVRATVERNTMRYYLAISAYLDSLATPPDQRLEKRLVSWFNDTELYKPQLHEVDRSEYMSMKRNEIARQQTKLE